MSYLECQLANLGAGATVQCDCEKQLADGSASGGQPITERSIAKPRAEEVFAGYGLAAPIGHASASAPTLSLRSCSPLHEGFAAKLFQPPRMS